MTGNQQAFSLPMFRKEIPEKLRFWIILLFPIIFQMSDAVYMGLSAEISSVLSFHSQDILYCGFAGMIGVTMTFPVLFRLKFRFTSRTIFLITSLGMASISFACLFIQTLPLLVVLSVVFGMLKLWGSFEAFSSIMLKVAPRYNFAPFLAVVFTVVFGGIELSGALSKVVIYFYSWEFMSYLMIGCQLIVALIALIGMVNFRPMPPSPLKGIDWIGMTLWTIMLMGFAFVFVYGEMLDWFNSEYIWIAVAIIALSLCLNLVRMVKVDKPYLELKTFAYRNMGKVLVIFFVGAILMSAESVLQHIYVEEVLGVGSFNRVSLNIAAFIGILAGGWLGYYAIDRLGIGFKRMTFLSILVLTMYEISMCSIISTETSISQLWIPLFFYGMGHSLLFIVLTTYIEGVVPLEHRFQALTVLGFIRIGCGAALGSSFLGHMFSASIKQNVAQLGSSLNHDVMVQTPFPQIVEAVSHQAVMVSLKEIYSATILIGIITMIVIAAIPMCRFQPSLSKIAESGRWFRRTK